MYNRGCEHLAKKSERLSKMRQEQFDKDMAECRFKPETLSNRVAPLNCSDKTGSQRFASPRRGSASNGHHPGHNSGNVKGEKHAPRTPFAAAAMGMAAIAWDAHSGVSASSPPPVIAGMDSAAASSTQQHVHISVGVPRPRNLNRPPPFSHAASVPDPSSIFHIPLAPTSTSYDWSWHQQRPTPFINHSVIDVLEDQESFSSIEKGGSAASVTPSLPCVESTPSATSPTSIGSTMSAADIPVPSPCPGMTRSEGLKVLQRLHEKRRLLKELQSAGLSNETVRQ